VSDPLPEVQAILPHRPPFLFVDRALELSAHRVVAVRRFGAQEPFFQGHFPGRPIVPGVLLLEGLAQTMAYAAIALGTKGEVYLVGIDRTRFKATVPPDREVRYEVELAEPRFGLLKGRGKVFDGETLVLEAELSGYHPHSGAAL
jgi:3-hydroxyacyl-[acyl-carrier-protein] dehydratase